MVDHRLGFFPVLVGKVEADVSRALAERRNLMQKLTTIEVVEDAVRELYLQMKDRELTAQKESLERTTQGLMQQKEQLLAHYKETESVGQKLETYKEKLRVDAQVERK